MKIEGKIMFWGFFFYHDLNQNQVFLISDQDFCVGHTTSHTISIRHWIFFFLNLLLFPSYAVLNHISFV